MGDKGETDIYWKFPDDEISYVIAGVQAINNSLEVPLEVLIKDSQKITFKIDVVKNIENTIYLKDKESNITYNISQKSATINLEPGTYSDRFFITFSNTSLSLDDEDFLSKDLNIYVDKESRKLVIKQQSNLEVETVKLFSILGQEILNWSPKNKKKEEYYIPLSKSLNTAVYIVKTQTNKGVFSKKIILLEHK